MTVSPKLAAAIDVFVELGWASAPLADAETLPLGTSEQRRVARMGLSSDAWGDFAETADGSYGWTSWIEVDHTMLALFALRVGVSATRVAQLFQFNTTVDDAILTRLLAARGPRFAEDLARSPRRTRAHAVRLIDLHDLPVPDDVAYLADWSRMALDSLDGVDESLRSGTAWCEPAVVLRRVPEHVRAGVAVGLPATETFGRVVSAALGRGLLDRDELLDLALTALDAAQRPGDRKVWVHVLTDAVCATDEELIDRADALVGVLAHGDSPVIELLAPRLIAGVCDDLLGDILAVTLQIRTKKTLRLLLAAAARHPRPSPEVVDAVAPLVLPLTSSTDRALARAALGLTEQWELNVAEGQADEGQVHGLWRPTPPVWQVPRFNIGEATAARLTEVAANLTRRPDGIVDIETERFLALANTVARDDVAAARTALSGIRPTWVGGLRCIPSWLTGSPNPLLDRPADERWSESRATIWAPAEAREGAVVSRLGEVPTLLSSPTWEDLRIDPTDLVARLQEYLAADALAAEADLFLALTRVDLTLVTDPVLAALDDLPVPILLQSGETASDTAGPLLRRYLSDPVHEPALTLTVKWRQWSPEPIVTPAALRPLPGRVAPPRNCYSTADFPTWGDAVGTDIRSSDSSEIGLHLRQVARRGTPLTPGLAVNLVGAQRSFHPTAAADGTLAIHEAWERGLLRPGVADVQFLDWAEMPWALAAFARAAKDLARDGLLAVVWPLLDDLLLASLRAPRMLAGTAEVVEVLETFVPEVEAALSSGLADPTALALPGVRAVAARPGSSQAVTAARRIVARLPVSVADSGPAPVARSTRQFDEVWASDAGTRPAVEDGATVSARWLDPTAPGKMLAVDLTLPDQPGTKFRVVKAWFYDLEHEGQCGASAGTDEAPGPKQPDSWLHWDPTLSRLVVSSTRYWRNSTEDPLAAGDPVPPLTTSMTAVLLASLCHTQATAAGSASYAMTWIISSGLIGSAAVTSAMRALLPHADISPARMVSLIESDPTTLPVLWPVLVESIKYAAHVDGPPPRWLNRVLDVTLLHADLLREAAQRGLLPVDSATWPGLSTLAARPGKSAVPTKARTLIAQLMP